MLPAAATQRRPRPSCSLPPQRLTRAQRQGPRVGTATATAAAATDAACGPEGHGRHPQGLDCVGGESVCGGGVAATVLQLLVAVVEGEAGALGQEAG